MIEQLIPINLQFHSGNKKVLVVTVRDESEAIVDLSGFTAQLRVARQTGAPALLQKIIGSGIVLTAPAAGELTVTLTTADTEPLKGAYVWELNVFDGAGDPTTVAYGSISILRNLLAVA